MEITEVRVKLIDKDKSLLENHRLLAYVSMVLDRQYCVHDLKIIQGDKDKFLAMPARKYSDYCRGCGGKNILAARFCNWCGKPLGERIRQCATCHGERTIICRGETVSCDGCQGRGIMPMYLDIVHPTNQKTRLVLEDILLDCYARAWSRSEEDGTVEPYYQFLESEIKRNGCAGAKSST